MDTFHGYCYRNSCPINAMKVDTFRFVIKIAQWNYSLDKFPDNKQNFFCALLSSIIRTELPSLDVVDDVDDDMKPLSIVWISFYFLFIFELNCLLLMILFHKPIILIALNSQATIQRCSIMRTLDTQHTLTHTHTHMNKECETFITLLYFAWHFLVCVLGNRSVFTARCTHYSF